MDVRVMKYWITWRLQSAAMYLCNISCKYAKLHPITLSGLHNYWCSIHTTIGVRTFCPTHARFLIHTLSRRRWNMRIRNIKKIRFTLFDESVKQCFKSQFADEGDCDKWACLGVHLEHPLKVQLITFSHLSLSPSHLPLHSSGFQFVAQRPHE